MAGSGRQLPIMIPASTMFSVHWERLFCPIVAVLNAPSPLTPTDMRLHAETPPVAQSDTPAPRFWFASSPTN